MSKYKKNLMSEIKQELGVVIYSEVDVSSQKKPNSFLNASKAICYFILSIIILVMILLSSIAIIALCNIQSRTIIFQIIENLI